MKVFITLSLIIATATAAPITVDGINAQKISNVQNIISVNNVNTVANSINGEGDDGNGPTLEDIINSLKPNPADVQPMPMIPKPSEVDVNMKNFQKISDVQNVISVNNVNTVSNDIELTKETIKNILEHIAKPTPVDEQGLAINADVDNAQKISDVQNIISINNVNTVSNDLVAEGENVDMVKILTKLNEMPEFKKAVLEKSLGEVVESEDGSNIDVDVDNIQKISNVQNLLSVINVNTVSNDMDNDEQLQALLEAVEVYEAQDKSAKRPNVSAIEGENKDGDLGVDFINAQDISNVQNVISVINVNTVSNDLGAEDAIMTKD